MVTVRVNCDPLADYSLIWANVAEEIKRKLFTVVDLEEDEEHQSSFDEAEIRLELAAIIAGQATPNIIRRLFQQLEHYTFIIVIDEFDRLDSQETSRWRWRVHSPRSTN